MYHVPLKDHENPIGLPVCRGPTCHLLPFVHACSTSYATRPGAWQIATNKRSLGHFFCGNPSHHHIIDQGEDHVVILDFLTVCAITPQPIKRSEDQQIRLPLSYL